jgi:hypothetical protein
MKKRSLQDRYQTCAQRIWRLFPKDPLPSSCPAQSWVERLEALLDRGMLQPRPPLKLPGIPCPQCKGAGRAHDTRERCPRCGGAGEIA